MSQQQEVAPPEVIYPQVVRVITDPIFPESDPNAMTMTWSIGADHPFIKGAKIFRMFVERGVGVDVFYLLNGKGENSVFLRRHHISDKLVRLVDEEMPPEVFVEELRIAEDAKLDDPDDDDDPDDETETPKNPPASVVS